MTARDGTCSSRRIVGALLLAIVGLLARPTAGLRAQHVDDLDELLRAAGLRALPGMTRAPSAARADGWTRRAEVAASGAAAVQGTYPVLLVPALFQDSDDPPTDTETLRRVFFTGPSERGTLPEFFGEASGGVFSVTGDVAPWHRTATTLEAATGGPSTPLGIGDEFGAYVLDAIQAADQALDFGQFDNDGPDGVPNSGDDDGRVDALAFIFAEVGRSCGGPGVWPHKSALAAWNDGQPYRSDDAGPDGQPIEANGYVIVSARECDGSPVERVAVIAHELGHELGLPDLYHPTGSGTDAYHSEYRRWVVGCWGLMAGGSWGCGPADEFPPFGPSQFSAWARSRLGWIDLATAAPDLRRAELVLDPVVSSRSVLRIPLDPDGRESFLVEYRTREGFDAVLPAEGVLVYRWNLDASFRPPVDAPRTYHISLLEADGDSSLLRTLAEGGNRGEASDAFVVDGVPATLSAVTQPGTRLADGSLTTVTIHRIAVEGGRAHLLISTAPEPGAVWDGGPLAFTPLEEAEARVPLGGGALPYSLSLQPGSAPAGVSLHVEGDELVVSGEPRETGSFTVRTTVVDALGSGVPLALALQVSRMILSGDLLLEALVSPVGTGLSSAQREVLDRDGNGNGDFDAGDLRAYLFAGS